MGRLTGVCAVCGRTGTDVYRCGVCGTTACTNCFMQDVSVCKRCLQKGLWVSDRGPE